MNRRRALFNPMQAGDCPVPLRSLKTARHTAMVVEAGGIEEVSDEWSLFTKKEERHAWWKGITEFQVDEHFLFKEGQTKSVKQKRGEGEVFPHEITAEECQSGSKKIRRNLQRSPRVERCVFWRSRGK